MQGYHYIAFAALAALAVLATGKPVKREADVGAPQDLDTVVNNTLCPTVVDTDYDPDRIPKRIKVLKCGNEPNKWCAAMGVPEAECCHHTDDRMRMQCVEVQDLVQVYYPKRDETQQYRVPIGCTCVVQQNVAVGSPSPWS